ncbi:hypothetical protein LWI28_016068 [Acer negundo]|uniref:Uncharacterized protein n=1 Tax=Acer negundo TaxID=4023 RepID=A0AAD5JTX6_ACENE|nr:hypothetical protein LWI28_016068 [Acer negundo]
MNGYVTAVVNSSRGELSSMMDQVDACIDEGSDQGTEELHFADDENKGSNLGTKELHFMDDDDEGHY